LSQFCRLVGVAFEKNSDPGYFDILIIYFEVIKYVHFQFKEHFSGFSINSLCLEQRAYFFLPLINEVMRKRQFILNSRMSKTSFIPLLATSHHTIIKRKVRRIKPIHEVLSL